MTRRTAIGADEVVGVKTYVHEHANLLEFMAIGTAVKKVAGVCTLSAALPPQAIMRDKGDLPGVTPPADRAGARRRGPAVLVTRSATADQR